MPTSSSHKKTGQTERGIRPPDEWKPSGLLHRLLETLRRHSGAEAACLWVESDGGLRLFAADPPDLPLGEVVPHPGPLIAGVMEDGAIHLVSPSGEDASLPSLPLLHDRLRSEAVAVLPAGGEHDRLPAAICLYLPRIPADPAPLLFEWSRWAALVGEILPDVIERNDRSDLESAGRTGLQPEGVREVAGGLARQVGVRLATILPALEQAGSLLDRDDPAQRFLLHVREGIDRTSDMMAHLLACADDEPIIAESVSVADCVAEAVRRLESERPPQVGLTATLPAGLPLVVADRVQVIAAFVEVVRNALEASPTSCAVSVEVTREERSIRITVEDEGPGMQSAVLARAVRPFFSTKRVAEHPGLGLTMAEGIIRRHGGRMAISSRLGGGTSVRMWIPVQARPPVAGAP
jgi:signal transduction histidine kinase